MGFLQVGKLRANALVHTYRDLLICPDWGSGFPVHTIFIHLVADYPCT